MDTATRYIVRHSTRESKAVVSGIDYRIDIHTLGRKKGAPLVSNEIGRVSLTTTTPLCVDPYEKNRATGSFILIDPSSFHTVAAGMIVDRGRSDTPGAAAKEYKEKNLHYEATLVTSAEREVRSGRRAVTVWMTGLSGSGKSTLAKAVERTLFDEHVSVYFLDGDNLRVGLNRGLGFSSEDRSENLRRAAEVAKLMNQAGITVICAFISPYAEDRQRCREVVGEDRFLEVHLDTSLEVCEARDPHGLYQKARTGKIHKFTGVSDPYEVPHAPALRIDTAQNSLETSVQKVVTLVLSRSAL
jgi:bifunctional enzyme CysN/CysC